MFRLKIETDGAAFNTQVEVARILREVADSVEEWGAYERVDYRGEIRDINGNTVGTWRYAPGEGYDD